MEMTYSSPASSCPNETKLEPVLRNRRLRLELRARPCLAGVDGPDGAGAEVAEQVRAVQGGRLGAPVDVAARHRAAVAPAVRVLGHGHRQPLARARGGAVAARALHDRPAEVQAALARRAGCRSPRPRPARRRRSTGHRSGSRSSPATGCAGRSSRAPCGRRPFGTGCPSGWRTGLPCRRRCAGCSRTGRCGPGRCRTGRPASCRRRHPMRCTGTHRDRTPASRRCGSTPAAGSRAGPCRTRPAPPGPTSAGDTRRPSCRRRACCSGRRTGRSARSVGWNATACRPRSPSVPTRPRRSSNVPVTLPFWSRMRMSPARWTRYSRPSPVPSPVRYTGAASAPTSMNGSSRSRTLPGLKAPGFGSSERRGEGCAVGASVAGASVAASSVAAGSLAGGSVAGGSVAGGSVGAALASPLGALRALGARDPGTMSR